MSNLINKVKSAMHSNDDSRTGTGTGSGTSHYDNPRSSNEGPHGSNVLNKADPRVDSDGDHRNNPTSGVGGYGHAQQGTTTSPTAGHHPRDSGYSANSSGSDFGRKPVATGAPAYGNTGVGSGVGTGAGYDNSRSTNAGPHNSNLANKMDPRVDSDRDGRGTGTGYNTTGTGAGYNTAGTGYNTSGNTAGYDNPRSANAGPHSSNLANKADPRVDSDLDGGRRTTGGGYNTSPTGAGYNTAGTGVGTGAGYNTTGSGAGYDNPRSTNAGPHNSNLANRADPRVDSDRDGRGGVGNTGYNTAGSGTAGPHDSAIANKLDPRVDSSRTDDHTTHSTARGTMEHDTRHTGAGQGSSNVSNTIGTGNDKMTHSTRHEGGGSYDSAAVHRSDAGHVDSSRTHHSGPGIHESSTTTGHNAAGATTSTTHTSTHSSPSGAGVGGVGSGVGSGVNEPYNNSGYGSPADSRTTTGSGGAGPHNSSLLNKLDPRVDSDGSKGRRQY